MSPDVINEILQFNVRCIRAQRIFFLSSWRPKMSTVCNRVIHGVSGMSGAKFITLLSREHCWSISFAKLKMSGAPVATMETESNFGW